MPRYILKPEKKDEWVALEKNAKEVIKLNRATWQRIGQRDQINKKTIDKLAHAYASSTGADEQSFRKEFFELVTDTQAAIGQRDKGLPLKTNDENSRDFSTWIEEQISTGMFTCIDILTYTNETLHIFLRQQKVEVRSLARNWLKEKEEATAFNSKLSQSDGFALSHESELHNRRPWKKHRIIEMAARLMNDKDTADCKEIEQKYYDESPILKGAILWNRDTNRRAAYFGFYLWDENRPEGGSPYFGKRWMSIIAEEDGGEQSEVISAVHSHFNRLWANSKTYEQMLAEDRANERLQTATNIWEIPDKLPYKIVIPGEAKVRSLEKNAYYYPDVKYADSLAAQQIRRFLSENGGDAKIEIMTVSAQDKESDSKKEIDNNKESDRSKWYDDNIRKFDGHVVLICSRTLTQELQGHLEKIGFPFEFDKTTPPERPYHVIRNRRTRIPHQSPLDFNNPGEVDQPPNQSDGTEDRDIINVDYCLIGKCRRLEPDKEGMLFIITGIHTLGTRGGSHFFTDIQYLNKINDTLLSLKNPDDANDQDPKKDEFAQVIMVEESSSGKTAMKTLPIGEPELIAATT